MNAKYLFRSIVILFLVALVSCKKSEPDEQQEQDDQRLSLIWASPNYVLDEEKGTVEYTFFVFYAGKDTPQPFSVSVQPDATLLEQKLGSIPNVAAIPADMYSIPATVDVSGQSRTNFKLTIDRNKLIEQAEDLYGKNLLITLKLAAPSNYTLDATRTTVAVVINSAEIIPRPDSFSLIKGGGFDEGDEQYWQSMPQDQGWRSVEPVISFNDNSRFSVSSGFGLLNHAIYQKIEVEEGKKYRFSAEMTASGVTEGWLEFYVHSDAPAADGDYASGRLFGFENPCLKGDIQGMAEDIACADGQAYNTGGVFTANFSGEGYFIIKFGMWNGAIGSITLDSLLLAEVLEETE